MANARSVRQREYQGTTEQKKDRAARNKARRQAIASGRARKGDGKDVHHKDGNPRNNGKGNTAVQKSSTNKRSGGRKGGNAKARKG